jgi:hypothetical protein
MDHGQLPMNQSAETINGKINRFDYIPKINKSSHPIATGLFILEYTGAKERQGTNAHCA